VRTASGREFKTKGIIAATGASPRRMGVPGEDRLIGRGVSYCATCDGFFFRNKDVVVIGGGDSALQESLFLTKFASRVRIIHRRDQLRAGAVLQRRAKENPKIEFVWNTVVEQVNGPEKVEGLTLRNLVTGEATETRTDGVFVYIGHLPNNALFVGKLAMDGEGYLISDKLMRTSVPGIFAAGEIQDHRFKQAATSAGQGVSAAMEVEKYLADLEDRTYPGREETYKEVELAA
jgi:thioredoxin reductase (NADPH)